MGRKSRKSEGPRTTETTATHHQHPRPAPTTTEPATAEAAEAGSEEATAHAVSPPVAMPSTEDPQHTIGSTSHASAAAEVDSLRAGESPRGPAFWGWGDGSPRSNQPKGSNATLDYPCSSARVVDAGSTLKPRPLFPGEPVGTDATDGAPPASPTPPSPPVEPPRSVLAGSTAMSPPSPPQATSPVPAAATSEVRSPAARPDPASLPSPPSPPPPPPPPPPPAAPISPSAEARSSRVKALLRRTAQLAEASSAGSSAPAIAESRLSPRLAPWAPSPTLVAAQLPQPPQSPELPAQEEAAAAAAAAASADFPLRVVQARLSSLGQLRTRVEGMLGSELAELEGMQALLLHHSRCKASEQAAADAMAAATRLLSGGGAEAERARGVTQIYGALQQYCQASDERLLLEQQSGPLLEPAAASPPPRARCGFNAAGADSDAPPPPPTPPAKTASEVEWPPSLGGMLAPELAGGGGGFGASLDKGHGATRHRSEALQALWGEVGALQHSIDAETAELAQAEAELMQPRGGARPRPRGGRAGGDAIQGDADDAFRTPLILRAPPPHDVPPQARAR